MKTILTFVALFVAAAAFGQKTDAAHASIDSTRKTQIVETSCGMCKFGMKSKDCSLAVRIDGKPYFVDGAKIDDFGDAHDKEGFCNAVRKAEVQGDTLNNRFRVTYIRVLPTKKP